MVDRGKFRTAEQLMREEGRFYSRVGAVVEGWGGRIGFREFNRVRPQKGQVEIRPRLVGIAPVDVKTAEGKGAVNIWEQRAKVDSVYADLLKKPFPHSLGWEAMGTIERVGDSVGEFAKGQRVITLAGFPYPVGTMAEYFNTDASQVVLIPDSLSDEIAATLPMNGLTALQAIEKSGIESGQIAIVEQAAGGVGRFMVQILKDRGVIVVGVASKNKELVKDLGADFVIDYSDQSRSFAQTVIETVGRKVDVLFDSLGSDSDWNGLDQSIDAVDEKGMIVSLRKQEVTEKVREGMTGVYHLVEPNRKQLAQLVTMAAEGSLTAKIDEVFPMKDAAEALKRLKEGKADGKILVRI